MKRKNIINKLFVAGALVMSTGLMSCDDYLTVLPSDRITEDDFWKNKADLHNVRAAAYAQMASTAVTDRILYWGELRADNLAQNNMTQTNIELLRKGVLHPTDGMFDWAPFYKGINYCNKVLEQGEVMTQPGQEVDPSFRTGDWLPIKAEMLSMRALYYFYLVRAYRNVPFVTHSISTDAEANNSRISATPGAVILSKLIEDLEGASVFAAEDYSNATDRKGRFTKKSVHALLADLYLWRSSLLAHADEKGDTLVIADSTGVVRDTLSQGALNKLSATDLDKVIEHCDYIFKSLQKEYDEDLVLFPEWADDVERNKDYPYMLFIDSKASTNVVDVIYSNIWGNKNSNYESVFELQYDGTILKNNTYNNYLSAYSSGNLQPKSMVGASEMTASVDNNYNPTRGFGKSDIRVLETFDYTPAQSQRAPFHKNVATSIVIPDLLHVTKEHTTSQYRNSDSQNANWPVYRLTDIMLMKAEAIARRSKVQGNVPKDQVKDDNAPVMELVEGFNLVNSIFKRCNPGLKATGTPGAGDAVSDRLKPAKEFIVDKSASDLLNLVYNERQREFVGEGKRWFDIVRQVEFSNNIASTLTGFVTLPKEVKNRLRTFWAMYVPIYSEELKVNGVEFGGGLRQNPVWDRYTVK